MGGIVMNENLDLTKILDGCPEGTKFYSSDFGEVTFFKVSSHDWEWYPIWLHYRSKVCSRPQIISLTKKGQNVYGYDGECTLFPSKEQRDWSKFNPKKNGLVSTCEFKDGDILSYQCKGFNNRSIYIYRYHKRFNTSYYVALSGDDNEFSIDNTGKWALNGYNDTVRFATKDEKKKLFQAIKDNGYKWNAKTKTLEKLVKPKFDPKTLNAFDKVLVRLTRDCIWNATFFSHYDKEINWGCHPCVTTSCKSYDKCIPYNDETKHLLGTSEEAPEYYRYWED